MTTTHNLDLTPFGFTPTESAAYGMLVTAGPSTGYGVAKALGIARANAYQALDGLVMKGAAGIAALDPKIYRATAANAVLAAISREQAAKLETLEQQLGTMQGTGEPATVSFEGDRELRALVLRTAARQQGVVRMVADADILVASLPVWRKRAADRHATELLPIGDLPDDFPIECLPALDASAMRQRFDGIPVLVSTPDAAIMGSARNGRLGGIWSSDPLFIGAAWVAVDGLKA